MVRQASWIAVLPQLLALAAAIVLGWTLTGTPRGGLYLGAGFYLAWSIGSRWIVARSHRQGIQLVRQGRFADAIPHFETSYEFFSRHEWLDRYRAFLLMSASAASYRDMALVNQAFCHAQTGNGDQAIRLYEQAQREFPASALASTALQLIRSTTAANSSP
ncbi:MAG: hypothetical protein WBC44_03920 [Planctomycetaceae bacterium]